MRQHLTNYHSHCNFCDGRAPMEDFVVSAIGSGFSSYGISSHSPLPDYIELYSVLQGDRVDDYIAQANELKEKYRDKIELYTGMEIDYIDDTHCPANEYFQSLDLDYRIGSVHFIKIGEREAMDVDTNFAHFSRMLQCYYGDDIRPLVCDYFDAKMRMVARGGFDFVAHPDKISLNALRRDPHITVQRWYQDKVQQYFRFIAEQGRMVEINTKAYLTEGLFFPNRQHFKLIGELGIPVVVNSDAHHPHLINAGREECFGELAAAGVGAVMELASGKWIEVAIY